MRKYLDAHAVTLTLSMLLPFSAYGAGTSIDVFVSADNVTCEKACEDAAAKAHSALQKKCDKAISNVQIGAGFCSSYDYTNGCSLTAVADCF